MVSTSLEPTSIYSYYPLVSDTLTPPSSQAAHVYEDWQQIDSTIFPTDSFQSYIQALQENKTCIDKTSVTIPPREYDSIEVVKQMIIEIMDRHPYLKALLTTCIENKGEITIALLKEKLKEYETNENTFLVVEEEYEISEKKEYDDFSYMQEIPSTVDTFDVVDPHAEFRELFSALDEIEGMHGENTTIPLSERGSSKNLWSSLVITFEDIQLYYNTIIHSPLLDSAHLNKAYALCSQAVQVTKTVSTCIAIYHNPWSTAFMLLAKVIINSRS